MIDTIRESHAQEFTDIERQTLRVWFDVDLAGNDTLADSVLNAGIQLEHYTSLLPDDPALRTSVQIQAQARLAFLLSEQLSQAMSFLLLRNPNAGIKAKVFRDSLPKVTESHFPDEAIGPPDTQSV